MKQAVFAASDYLLLDALKRRPMTTRELSHTIQVSSSKTLKRLHEYEKHGLVVKGVGHKWHAALVLWVAPSKDRVEGVTGSVPKPDKQAVVALDTILPDAPQAHQIAPRPTEQVVPDLSPAPEPPKPYSPPRTRVKGSVKAQTMAARFRIPAVIEGRGDVSMGPVAQCIMCTVITTPFKYGTDAICPKCARGGK